MAEADPFENDPFFKSVGDPDWNACIGRQGEEENYVDGYIEAAIELADAVIEKQLFGKRDTLVLPILYNARHAIELSLKFATDRLVEAHVVNGNGRKRDHDIKAHWDRLSDASIGDEKLAKTIAALEPFIASLSRIDSDGQELRYHRNRDNDPSLSAYTLANLELIRASLRILQRLIADLQYRTVDFLSERATGSHTTHCSRSDLLAIAGLMPPRDQWNTEQFDLQKAVIRERFGLGNRQLSLALDKVQENREMAAILGIETSLLHLSDEDIVGIVADWRRVHPKRETSADSLGLDYFRAGRFEEMREHLVILADVVGTLAERLSAEKLADLEAAFYVGRDRIPCEYYEASVVRKLREHAVANNPRDEVRHLVVKTNLLQCLTIAATKLGRVTLAKRLSEF
ncbi:hypothetical protein FJW08_21250 [Mesorhizobium sp. B3-2-1]|uniref:hypothetical protein n=1 Tax=Mesorhizobium sp. B3-2-1 TaxID=2589891 RepID=UPI0011291BD4|nr:hypothetical protein [Mesorhizobium sp. B3-2-1]TPI28304.1 hypothetical protein FJW08_21250 [Mesorhizobium sp. B3-2-1]